MHVDGDLDADGVAEVTFQYTLQCTSDLSPATRKLILREGKDKYAIRGTNRSRHFEPRYVTRDPDPAFARAPAAFLKHALEQWEAFVEVGHRSRTDAAQRSSQRCFLPLRFQSLKQKRQPMFAAGVLVSQKKKAIPCGDGLLG